MTQTAARASLADDLARIALLVAGDPSAPRSAAGDVSVPIDRLCAIFGLSDFERDVLLMCAGMELDAACAGAITLAQDGAPPSFSLALAALPDAHWSALLPSTPLRYWQLVTLGDGPSLVGAALRIDERVLHYLLDLAYLDPRLATRLAIAPAPRALVPSHQAIADRLVAVWQADGPVPVIELHGADPAVQADIAAAASAATGQPLLTLDARDLPDDAETRDAIYRLIDRETLLADAALLVIADADPVHQRALDALIARAIGPLVVATALPRGGSQARTVLTIEVARPAPEEQLAAWRSALAAVGVAPPADLRALAYQFDLDLSAIRAAATDVGGAPPTDDAALLRALWHSSRIGARTGLGSVAQRIAPSAGWNALVLPERERRTLAAIVDQVRHRATVYGDWGFAGQGTRGLGIAALFAGPSGTGKTLAAEVIAAELGLDLYRIDLSAVVNKYIGETEKNLKRVFDAAEAGGAVLLFDEADALFGKRSEVKDSHDRHANIEVSYLLSRVESYRGIAILTTNLKENIDPAFLRRLRFIVQFPFPDAALRAAIWDRAFPPGMPRDGLDSARLAQLNITGGSIRNIALNAAFAAAANGGGVTMADVRTAALAEYAKTERAPTATETRGWE